MEQLPARNIEAHHDWPTRDAREFGGFAATFDKNPATEFKDETRFFGGRDEFVGMTKPAHRVLPAHEAFETVDTADGDVGQRLIVQAQLAALDGTAQIDAGLRGERRLRAQLGRE